MFPYFGVKKNHPTTLMRREICMTYAPTSIHSSDHSFVMWFDIFSSFYSQKAAKRSFIVILFFWRFCGFTRARKDLSVKSISYQSTHTQKRDASSNFVCCPRCCCIIYQPHYQLCCIQSIICNPHNHNQFSASKPSIFFPSSREKSICNLS